MSNYEKVKAWRAKNTDKVNAQSKRYRAKHPEAVAAVKKAYRERHKEELLPREAEQARKRRAADPEGNRRRMQAFLDRKKREREQIAGRPHPSNCELCGEAAKTVFDHCHTSGKFRGWLCDRCNRVLGSVKDSPRLLGKMIDYLERSNGSLVYEAAEITSGDAVRVGKATQVSN